jgi:thymidine kinase
MFAGKSTELLRRMNRHKFSGKSCLYVKYIDDTRYCEKSIATHDLAKELAVSVRALTDLGDSWKNYDCIGIDEGQFYKDVVAFAELAASEGKIVIMSVLSGTSFRKPFNDVLDLIPKCEKVKQLQAICKICSHPASFTLRTTACDTIELIGGGDIYMPVCRECFNYKTQQ